MKVLRILIIIILMGSILGVGLFLASIAVLEHDLPGIVLLSIFIVFLLNIIFCLFSLYMLMHERNKLVQKLWISYFALIAGYLIFDYIAGQLVLKKISPVTTRDATLHHVLIPNITNSIDHFFDYNTTIRSNNIGCRGEDVIESQENDKIRILMLGDSFTMGRGVNDNETFSYVLEQKLNSQAGDKFEVINCGVQSYTPLLEYLQLKQNYDFIKPDIVILNFDMGDLLQEYTYRKVAEFDDSGEILAVSGFKQAQTRKEPAIFRKTIMWVYKNMLFGANLLEQIYKMSLRSKTISFENVVTRSSTKSLIHTLKDYDDEQYEEILGYVEESMLKLKDFCLEKGCEYIITIYPRGHQVSDEEWIPGRYSFIPKSAEISDRTVFDLQEFADKNNILFINTFPDFRSYSGDKRLFYDHDAHWTNKGHEVMADSIRNFLDEQQMSIIDADDARQ